jgi:hypothetical protein
MRTAPSIIRPETVLSESSTSGTMSTLASHKSVDVVMAEVRDTNTLNPSGIRKSRLEATRPRHGAVDAEILRYFGSLAKKDSEGFVYPSGRHTAEKIGRSSYYVSLRIRFLEGLGRIIRARRIRNGRELDGWLVLRYDEWKKTQPNPHRRDGDPSINNLRTPAKNSEPEPNNFGSEPANNARRSMKIQPDNGYQDTRSSCLERRFTGDDCYESQSQSTTATATVLNSNIRESFKTRKQKLENRLIDKIKSRGETLQQYLHEFPEPESESLVKLFRAACKFLAYAPDEDSPDLAYDFCWTLGATWEKHQRRLHDGNMEPSALCSKVIDSCVEDYILWPPSFSEHRSLLRGAEKSGQLQFVGSDTPNGNRIRLRVYPKSLPKRKKVRL